MLTGCATPHAELVKSITNQYEAIEFHDGVSLAEAKVIAQRMLVRENLVKLYDLANPKNFKDTDELPYNEQYWFIFFKEKKVANIEFVFMTIIDKQTGKVKFANDYKEGKDWILEAALLGG